MEKLCFTTTVGWDLANGFSCASLGLAGICDNTRQQTVTYPDELEGIVLAGSYEEILSAAKAVTVPVHAPLCCSVTPAVRTCF